MDQLKKYNLRKSVRKGRPTQEKPKKGFGRKVKELFKKERENIVSGTQQGQSVDVVAGPSRKTMMRSTENQSEKDAATDSEDHHESDTDPESFIPTKQFTPVWIEPTTPTYTTILTEEILFDERAKLFRFNTEKKEWLERGVGNIQILMDQTVVKIRIIMLREGVKKLACNHLVTKYLKIGPVKDSPKAATWPAIDYAEGEAQPHVFSCRFKTEAVCSLFLNKMEEMIRLLKQGQ